MLTKPPRRLLRTALRLNAGFSALSGLAFALPTRLLPAFTGLPSSLLINLGLMLIGFAAFLVWLSSRPMDRAWIQRLALGVVVLDVLWVIGTGIALFAAPMFTPGGRWLFGGLAVVVAAFAELQGIALWRLHALDPQPQQKHATG